MKTYSNIHLIIYKQGEVTLWVANKADNTIEIEHVLGIRISPFMSKAVTIVHKGGNVMTVRPERPITVKYSEKSFLLHLCEERELDDDFD